MAVRIFAVGYGASGQCIDGGDDRCCDARTTKDVPIGTTSATVTVVDRHTGIRVCYRRNICHGAISAPFICLPCGLGDVATATASSATPYTLRPTTCGGAVFGQARAAHSGDILGCSWELNTIAIVAGAHGNGDARVIVGTLIAPLAQKLVPTVAVADRAYALLSSSCIHCCTQVGEAVGVGFDQQDIAIGTNGAGHVKIQSDLLSPTGIGGRGCSAARRDVAGCGVESLDNLTTLVHLCNGWTGCQTELLAVGLKVLEGARVVVGVYYGNGLSRTLCC